MSRKLLSALVTAAVLGMTSGCAARYQHELEMAVCTASNEALGAVATTAAEVAKTTAAVAELEGTARELTRIQLRSAQAIIARLQASFDACDIEIETRDGQMVVQLQGSVLYSVGEIELTPEGEQALEKIAEMLKENPDRRFLVAGHTDDMPVGSDQRYRSNRELSVLRAVSAVEFLESRGVPPAQLIAAGFGEHQPLSANDTEDGRARNRRLEIVMLPVIYGDAAPSGVAAAPADMGDAVATLIFTD